MFDHVRSFVALLTVLWCAGACALVDCAAAVTHLAEPQPPRLVLPAGHTEAIISLAVTPDERWLLSLGRGYELKLWERSTGTDMGTLIVSSEPGERNVAVFARHDAQAYVITSKRVLLVDVPTLVVQQVFRVNGEMGSATLSSDREQLWLGGLDGTKMHVTVLRRGKGPLRRVFEMEATREGGYIRRDGFGYPVVSPNGKYAVPTRGPGETLRLIRLEDRSVVKELAPAVDDQNLARGTWATFLQDGTLVFCRPSTVKNQYVVENLAPDTLAPVFPQTVELQVPHSSSATAPGASNQVIIAVGDGLRIWTAGEVEGPFGGGHGTATAAVWLNDGRHAEAGFSQMAGDVSSYSVRRFDRASTAFTGTPRASTLLPARLAASVDGRTLHIIDSERRGTRVRITPRGLETVRADVPNAKDAGFSPSTNQLVVAGGALNTEVAFFAPEGAADAPRRLNLGAISTGHVGSNYIAVSPSETYIADYHFQETRVVEAATGRVIRTFPAGFYGFDAGSCPAAFSPDNRRLAVVTVDHVQQRSQRMLRCYDLSSGQVAWSTDLEVHAMRFSEGGLHLRAVAYENFGWRLMTFNPATGQRISTADLANTEVPHLSVYDPSGTLLAHTDGANVIVYNTISGKETLRLACQSVRGIAFFGEHMLATIGAENAVRLWDRRTRQLAGTITLSANTGDWAFVHPSGRFDASPGFQKDLYFVHDGAVIPLGAYFETFYTPGLGAQVLSGEAVEVPAFELKDMRRPPTVQLALVGAASGNGADTIVPVATERTRLSIKADGQGNPIEEVRLYHNGKLVRSRQRNLTVEDDQPDKLPTSHEETREVVLVPGENTFRLVALNRQRTESAPADLRIAFTPPASSKGVEPRGAQLHLFVVGLNTYRNPKYNLNYAVADANAVKTVLENSTAGIFKKVHVHTLFNEQATRTAMATRFEQIAEAASPADVFVFYYAGHGVMSADAKAEFFLVPHEVTQLYGADELLREKALSSSQLLEYSQLIPAQKQLFLLDACQSAGALQTLGKRGGGEDKAIAQLARASGTHWITASGSEQFATEFEKLGHGTFTYALLEGLAGKADNGDGRITVNELKAWLEAQVPELTKLHKGTPQYPATYGFGQDFPVVTR